MIFKNPIKICNLFATKTYQELEDYCLRYTGQERVIALTIMGMTMNMCAQHVDWALKEWNEETDEAMVMDYEKMKRDIEQDW